jgi:ribosomal protein S8
MMRSLFLLFLLLFFACSNKPHVPKGILPPDKMQAVLLDMLKADEYINQFGNIDTITTNIDKRKGFYQAVLKTHKTNQKELKKSFDYYQNRPDLLQVVLDSMRQDASRKPVVKSIDTLKKR